MIFRAVRKSLKTVKITADIFTNGKITVTSRRSIVIGLLLLSSNRENHGMEISVIIEVVNHS